MTSPNSVHELDDDVGTHPRTRRGGEPQRAAAVAVADLVGQIHDPVEHHRHDAQPGGAVAVDELQGGLRVELAAGDDRARHRRGEHQLREPPGVEHRRDDDDGLLGAPRGPVEDRLEHLGSAAGVLGALGCSGGARRQQDQLGLSRSARCGCCPACAAISFSTVGSCAVGLSVHATMRVASGLSASARSTVVGELLVVDDRVDASLRAHAPRPAPGRRTRCSAAARRRRCGWRRSATRRNRGGCGP